MIREEGPANGNEDENITFDCMKQSESLKIDLKLPADKNELEGEREVGLPLVESLCGSNTQEAQMALKLGFTLPASCYATMAIRELLKTSTSVRI